MNDDRPVPEDSATHWSMVANAHDPEVFAALWNRFEPMLRRYLRQKFGNIQEHDRDDILQRFMVDQVWQGQLLQKADPNRGKMRTFLRFCLLNFVRTWLRQKGRDKLSQAAEFDENDEFIVRFDEEWARQLIVNALSAMRDECQRKEQDAIWNIFFHCVIRKLVYPEPTRTFEELADDHGLKSARHARNKLAQGKRKFQRLLRQIVEETLTEADDADDEMHDLFELVLGCAGELIKEGAEEHPSVLDSQLKPVDKYESVDYDSIGVADSAKLKSYAMLTDEEATDTRAALDDELQRTLLEVVEAERRIHSKHLQPSVHEAQRSIGELILGKTTFESLDFVRRHYRSRYNRSDEKDVLASVLYHLLWGAIFLEHGKINTRLEKDKLLRSWQRIAEYKWLKDELRQRLLDARTKLAQL